MCGIVGWVGFATQEEQAKALVKTLSHRGPDDWGYLCLDGSIFLGHTRLKIIDLSDAGRQPMTNEDLTLFLCYNGEIYNFEELRSELSQKGHRFRSKTDTEVILHLYEEEGANCLKRLNGMFAFALYDQKNKCLLLARDRLGEKPLYYAHTPQGIAFASEIKALLEMPFVKKDLDWQALWHYFSFLFVPHPFTAFKSIRTLPPAHFLLYDLDAHQLKIQRYWKPFDLEQAGGGTWETGHDYEDKKTQVRELLSKSVRMRLQSDVPLGLFLSGGIDSSIITALAARDTQHTTRTFTVLFSGDGIKPYDETEYARRIAHRFQTAHREMTADISEPDELAELISCFDQPFANPTFYLSYLLSKKTREHVTVALCGAGGDELFGGYPRYRALHFAHFLSKLPAPVGKAASAALSLLPEKEDSLLPRRLKLLARGIGHELAEQYLRWTYYFSDTEKQKLLAPLISSISPLTPSTDFLRERLEEASPFSDLPDRIQFLDLCTFLSDNILEYTDKTSMKVSLEVRSPFLDHRLVELSFKIPFRQKLGKRILKDAFSDLVPKENLAAPKRGFCPPLPTWMKKLDRYFDEQMTPAYIRKQGIFDEKVITSLRHAHRKRRRDNSMELFALIIFDLWWKLYVEQR